MEFKRNKETGILEAWDKGRKIGQVTTMGDMASEENTQNNEQIYTDRRPQWK